MSDIEMYELAGLFCGLTEEETENILNNDEDFDTPLHEKFGIDFDQFGEIIDSVEKNIIVGISPISGKAYISFGTGGRFVGFKKEIQHLCPS